MTQPDSPQVVDKPVIDRDLVHEPPGGAGMMHTRPIEELLHRLGPKMIFGEAVHSGSTTVIPVAEVRTGFGFGGGSGTGKRDGEVGSGGGGGAGTRVVPRGYIRVTGDDVRFQPILDATRLVVAGFALTAWVTFVLVKAFKG